MIGRNKSIWVALIMMCSSLATLAGSPVIPGKAQICVNVRFLESKPNDTLTLKIDDVFHIANGNPRTAYTAKREADGYFRFIVPVDTEHGYFTLSKARISNIATGGNLIQMCKPQFWEKTDSVDMTISFKDNPLGRNGICTFTGRNVEKYTAAYKIATFADQPTALHRQQDSLYRSWDGNPLTYNGFDEPNPYTMERLALLDRYRKKISDFSYQVMKADIYYAGTSVLGKIQKWAMENGMNSLTPQQRSQLMTRFNRSFDYPNYYGIAPQAMAYAQNYLIHLHRKLQAASFLAKGTYSFEWIYESLKKYQVDNEVRDLMIMILFSRSVYNSTHPATVYHDALTVVKNPAYRQIIKTLLSRTAGATFGAFILQDPDGKNRSTAEFNGKVILIDIWYTGCGACADFYTNVLSKVEESLKDAADVRFLSISIDLHKETWLKSIAEGKYTSSRVVNFYTGGRKDKHPIITDNNILTYPSVILLDKEGKIRFINSENLKREESLLKAIRELL